MVSTELEARATLILFQNFEKKSTENLSNSYVCVCMFNMFNQSLTWTDACLNYYVCSSFGWDCL